MTSLFLQGFDEGSPYTGPGMVSGIVETSDTYYSAKAWKLVNGDDELYWVGGDGGIGFDNETVFSVCWHFKIVSLPGSGETFGMIAGCESPSYTEENYSYMDQNGDIIVKTAGNITITSLSEDVWYVYICHWTDNSNRFHEIRRVSDGEVMATGTQTGSGAANDILNIAGISTSQRYGSQSNTGGTVIYDNIVIDTTQAVNLIDAVIGTEQYAFALLTITGAGDAMEWGTGSYADIDELPSDDASTVITQGGGSGDLDALCELHDLYAVAPRPVKDVIGLANWCRRLGVNLGSGGAVSRALIKSGSTESEGSGSAALSWSWVAGNWVLDPDTAAAWAASAVNALQCGSRVEALNARGAQCSASFVYVLFTPAAAGNRAFIIS